MAPEWRYTLHAFKTRFLAYTLGCIIVFIIITRALFQAVLNNDVY